VAFTSASQASNLFTVAQYHGKEASLKQSLGRTLVASIGPVCSVALRKLAVRVDIEAKPPKLGPFIEAINSALSDPCVVKVLPDDVRPRPRLMPLALAGVFSPRKSV
jgi:Uroporphyrinogen-III synthase HemD